MKFILIICILVCSSEIYSQISIIKGTIKDERTKKPIYNVRVSLENDPATNTYTDSMGKFEISVAYPEGESIFFTKEGYKQISKKLRVNLGETRNLPTEYLSSISHKIKETYITSRKNQDEPKNESKIELNQGQVNPSGNVESNLKYQGLGVGGNNELGSQFSVRGGSFDENSIYINDFEMYRPTLIRNAQQEGLSFANANLIRNMKFSSGGFAPEYGDKLSSVLDIQYKNPKKWAGSFDVGVLGVNAHVEGSLFKNHLNILSGFRYRNNGYLLSSQETKGQYTPRFLDWQTDINIKISNKVKLELLTILSSNKFNLIPEDRETNFGLATTALTYRVKYFGQERDSYFNFLQGLSLTVSPKDNFYIKFIASGYYIDERQNYDITGQYAFGEIESDINSSNFQNFKNVLGSGIFQNWGREHYVGQMYSGGIISNLLVKKHNIKFGIKGTTNQTRADVLTWDRQDSAGYNIPLSPNGIVMSNYGKLSGFLNLLTLSVYIQDEFNFTIGKDMKAGLVYGIRALLNNQPNEFLISPRIHYFMNVKPNWTLYTSIGSYNQRPTIREYITPNVTINPQVVSQKSLHFILGSDNYFKFYDKVFKFTTEAYYKYLWDVNTYQYNNVLIRYEADNNAKAYAYGIDLRLQGEFVEGATSWFNIGFLQTKENDGTLLTKYIDSFGGSYFNPKYAQTGIKDTVIYPRGYIQRPNNQQLMFNVFFQDYIPKFPRFRANFNLILASGLPFGPPNSEPYRNYFNLLSYKRLDLGFSFTAFERKQREKLGKVFESIVINFDIFNVVGFQNQVSMTWIKDYENNQLAVPNYLTGRRINARLLFKF